MGTYTFRRAKIRKPETWTLTDDSLSRDSENIVLRDITEVMFEQTAARRLWVTVIKFVTEDKTHTLQCNDSFSGPNRQQFLALAYDTVQQLNRTGSSASVRQGKGALIGGWMLAIAGLALAIGGLFFLYAGITGGSGKAAPFVIGGGALLVGALFVKMGEPWKAQPDVDLAGLSLQLANIRAMMTGH